MDYRLSLFLHVPMGLGLDASDVERLLVRGFDEQCCQAVLDAVRAPRAVQYLRQTPDWLEVSAGILERSASHGVIWSHIGRSDYPEAWMRLSIRPVVFSYKGNPCWQTNGFISVVGSRTPAPETLAWMQRDLGRFLKSRNVGVVSGGARGVDQWSHRLAVDCLQPTICILPTGILNPYPEELRLWERIVKGGGCLLSTCSLDEPLRKHFFHIRNRWVAGLSELCLVTEANRRSGSMLTAQLALSEGKQICTLPVSPMATQGLGNLDLLFEGAQMIRDHYDLTGLWDKLHP